VNVISIGLLADLVVRVGSGAMSKVPSATVRELEPTALPDRARSRDPEPAP
jgi:hypothetical protein